MARAVDAASWYFRKAPISSTRQPTTDPKLGIEWPLGGVTPLVSAKDAQGMSFKNAEVFP